MCPWISVAYADCGVCLDVVVVPPPTEIGADLSVKLPAAVQGALPLLEGLVLVVVVSVIVGSCERMEPMVVVVPVIVVAMPLVLMVVMKISDAAASTLFAPDMARLVALTKMSASCRCLAFLVLGVILLGIWAAISLSPSPRVV